MTLSNENKSSFSWKIFISAFVITFIINIVIAIVTNAQPAKNIWWTVLWMYFTIDSWKYWKWKALLPYPLYFVAGVLVSAARYAVHADKTTMYSIILATLNIGGLIVFYLLLKRTKATQEVINNDINRWNNRI
jgi:hypothetical protein